MRTEAGLWGAILVGFFAALFGGTPSLIPEHHWMDERLYALKEGLTMVSGKQNSGKVFG